MTRHGIVLAAPNGNVARLMRAVLMKAAFRDWVSEEDFGWAANERALFHLARQYGPRLVVLDPCFAGAGTADVVTRLARRGATRVVVLSLGACDERRAALLVSRGADSYLDIRGDEEEFRHGASRVMGGGRFVPRDVEDLAATLEAPRAMKRLTPAQARVLRLWAAGKRQKEIAALLGVTVNTVKTHRAVINRLAGGSSAADYIRYGVEHGIISADEIAGEEEIHGVDSAE